MPGIEARRWIARGRVQGVGFRWFILGRAQSLGVRGWASNLPDGSVEVVGMATAETLDRLQREIQKGPAGADVTEVAVADIPHEAVDTKSFIIKR